MNPWLILLLAILITGYLLDALLAFLTLKALRPELPAEFIGTYDSDEYRRSQEYTRSKTQIAVISASVSLVAFLLFLLAGGFGGVDRLARSFGLGEIPTGLIFTAILLLLNFLLGLPFSLYSTFVIEQRFGFNTTSAATYITDRLKAAMLSILLGGPLLAAIYWFLGAAGSHGWIYCWLAVVLFSLIVQFLAPVLILPLFNTFSPLADGPLRRRIMEYASYQGFQLQGIFTMDGSKRSTKLNAFFTGFGRFRKIVFYDTLMAKLSDDEIIAVLAHEMGHWKLGHIVKMTAASALQSGLMFYLLSLIIDNRLLFDAFAVEHLSVYASLAFFGILYTPVNIVVSIAFHALSRSHEFQADRYAVLTTGLGSSLISGLKKLCQANLANLTPHPFAVFLEYTHPPILQRIEAIHHLHQ